VSFEYRSVAITRPWFRPGLFKARFWRLPDGVEPLSDGADPATGRCPAYVSALVFARNVVVTYKAQVGGTTDTGAAIRFLRLEPAMLSAKFIHLASAAETPTSPEVRLVRDHRGDAPTVSTFSPSRAALRLRAADFSAATVTAAPIAVAVTEAPAPTTLLARSRLRLGSMLAGPVLVGGATLAPEPAPPPTPEPPPPAPSREGEVMVLAFICKRTPRSPDPDPTLTWT
jgi:hypothetical protein